MLDSTVIPLLPSHSIFESLIDSPEGIEIKSVISIDCAEPSPDGIEMLFLILFC
jgi:hypothetical protein